MTLYLARSQPRGAFKSLLGQANHLIITALVGLDGVERGVVTEVPKDLRTVWSPKDAASSAKRSRRLILDMALIRAVDSVDIYLRDAVRKPALVQSVEFRRELDAAGLSIFAKLQAIERQFKSLNPIPLAILFLMVAWRNRSAHAEADRDAPERHLEVLRSGREEISAQFSGLDVDMLLGGYDAMRPATFKEVASLINAAHHLVAELDVLLLSSLDIERFLKDVVWVSLGDTKRPNELAEDARKRRSVSVWGMDPADRPQAVLKFLAQQGFSAIPPKHTFGLEIPGHLVEELQQQTPKSVVVWAQPADRSV